MHFTFNFTRRNNEREKLETGLCRLSKSNFKVFFITILRIKKAEEADFGMELAFNLRRYIERKIGNILSSSSKFQYQGLRHNYLQN